MFLFFLGTGRARKIGARGTESAHCDVTQASRQVYKVQVLLRICETNHSDPVVRGVETLLFGLFLGLLASLD